MKKEIVKKEEVIASRVPPDLVEYLKKYEQAENVDRSTAIRKLLQMGLEEWKRQNAVNLYQKNKVTLAKAAEEAGLSVREMMVYLRQGKIAIQYDIDDFETDMKGLDARWADLPPGGGAS